MPPKVPATLEWQKSEVACDFVCSLGSCGHVRTYVGLAVWFREVQYKPGDPEMYSKQEEGLG